MSAEPGVRPGGRGPSARIRGWVAGWDLWEVPRRLVAPVFTVELTALALMLYGLLTVQPESRDLRTVVLICVLGVVHTEIARDVERMRRRITGEELHVDLGSVWFFMAAVLLPPGYAAAVTVLVHSHIWYRAAYRRAPLYRQVFNSATMMISAFAASSLMRYVFEQQRLDLYDSRAVLVLLFGMLAFLTINSALVAGAIAVSTPNARLSQMVGVWSENLLEIATLSLGALVAVAYLTNPWLALFCLPPLLVLHRAVLVRQLEEAASLDGKTGLLNAAAWHVQAERALQRAKRRDGPPGVLVLDLDHFKAVNDTHGHLAGDRVLTAVAEVLRDEVRERDLVGRFGGEEFVVMLAGLGGRGPAELEAVAERIRRRVADLRVEIPTPDGPLTVRGLSVSVGCAVMPDGGAELRDLLEVADRALYAAKHAGRNAVRMGTTSIGRPALLPVNARADGADAAEPPALHTNAGE
ncbi:MAG TPA: diguanylate cyclase [Pseudonocardia sp.]|uniref:GGDEF domain-containing protein n=1 Tax=Pseudonocardia sp. TaxID=60912 RepID=UPI002B4AD204|nr:diguanylate cyclase [Pseudonocardia sp.]HLU55736.1 diguanylate cyclase [Pseudonocardia sp.]